MTHSRHRQVRDLTLGFLTLGPQSAPLDVVEAAASAGFGAAGLRVSGRNPGDPWPSVDGRPGALAAVAQRARELGVRVSSVSGYYLSERTGPEHLLANVEAARLVGATLIAQGCFEPDLDRAASLLHGYARAAAGAGLRIALGFMPMSSLRSIADAQRVMADSRARNVGLLVDALHLVRSGAPPSELALIDPATVYLAQLCDALPERASGVSLFDEAMSGRMYVGDGGLDLPGLVDALPAGLELELETPVTADAELPSVQRAQRAAAKAQAFFDRHFPR